MASTLVKIDVHLIFHVKSTGTIMREDNLGQAFSYIGGIIKGMGGIPIVIGGMPDHVHILTSVPTTIAFADFVRTIKAKSSKWLRTLDESYYRSFAWQEGYGAFSVSASLTDKTVNYIRGQAEHHKRRSFQEEYRLFLEAYGIQYDERYAFCD